MRLLGRPKILNLVPRLVCDLDIFSITTLQVRIVAQYYNFILCDVYICLDSMRASIDCGAECAEGVLWVFGFVAAVSDTLRSFPLRCGEVSLYEGWRQTWDCRRDLRWRS